MDKELSQFLEHYQNFENNQELSSQIAEKVLDLAIAITFNFVQCYSISRLVSYILKTNHLFQGSLDFSNFKTHLLEFTFLH